MCTLKVFKRKVTAANFYLNERELFCQSHLLCQAPCGFKCTFILGYEDVWGAPLCWLSHIQQGCCGCKTASGVSMYKQAYKWSTICLFIFILLTVNKAEQALTPSNKWRPTHANSAAVGNQGGLFELRSILLRKHWLLDDFSSNNQFFCKANHVFMYSEIWCCNDCVCLCCTAGFYGEMCVLWSVGWRGSGGYKGFSAVDALI